MLTKMEIGEHIASSIGKNMLLTPRESECLDCLMCGKSAKQIAQVLCISHRTVEIHLANLKQKLGCRTRLEVVSKVNKFIT